NIIWTYKGVLNMGGMDIRDLNKLALNINDKVRQQLQKNNKEQNQALNKSLDTKEAKLRTQKAADVKKAENALEGTSALTPSPKLTPAPNDQSTKVLSDPKEDALKRKWIFRDQT
ncbi:MAG: hypothetical protein NT030_07130, partial [Candidatus Saganbacteria bacterium]|nr:hypothetical protein [Candidatus Saganbacteria bacterium]